MVFHKDCRVPTRTTLLVAFTVADTFFKRLYGPDTTRAKKRYRLYTSFFSDMNKKLLKQRMICSREISVLMCKSSVYFSAPPHFLLVPPQFGGSGDGNELFPLTSYRHFLLRFLPRYYYAVHNRNCC